MARIIQACVYGAVGLPLVGFGVYGLVVSPQRPSPYDLLGYWFNLVLGILSLVMAAQQLADGLSKEVRDWVDRAFNVVLAGGVGGALLQQTVESAAENVLSRSILAATALAMLLLAAGWLLSHPRRKSHS